MYNKPLPPNYIDFEDSEVARVCAISWGDFDERVITDNGDNTVNIIDSFVRMKNTSETKRVVTNTQLNVDNSGGIYVEGTTKTALGITRKQCEAVTTLGVHASSVNTAPFYGNSLIVTFPELKYFTKVTHLSRACFQNCSNLEHIDLTNIESAEYCFIAGTKIESLVFEEGFIGLIDQYGLYVTPSVLYLDLPSTTTTIGNYNFKNHNSMVIVCRATTPPTRAANNDGGKRLYVPQTSLEDYATAWPYFANNNKLFAIEGSYYETHRELDPNEA